MYLFIKPFYNLDWMSINVFWNTQNNGMFFSAFKRIVTKNKKKSCAWWKFLVFCWIDYEIQLQRNKNSFVFTPFPLHGNDIASLHWKATGTLEFNTKNLWCEKKRNEKNQQDKGINVYCINNKIQSKSCLIGYRNEKSWITISP